MHKIAINAFNIRRGGGVTHLVELLNNVIPEQHNIEQIVVWGNRDLIARLPKHPWLQTIHIDMLEKGLIWRLFWQIFIFPQQLIRSGCSVLFVPGSSYSGKFQPFVTAFRNMLPFDWQSHRRYFPHLAFFKLLLLRYFQRRTFKHATGIICLNKYAKKVLQDSGIGKKHNYTVIPHGINPHFFCKPQIQKSIAKYSQKRPFRLIYISIIEQYKHQCEVATAVHFLCKQGLPVEIVFIGPAYPPALKKFSKTLKKLDPEQNYLKYIGPAQYSELPEHYAQANGCVFASSCENFPNILLEGMASGLPIACSKRSVMPEVLQDGGVYFDPTDSNDIVKILSSFIQDAELRTQLSKRSYSYAQQYSWKKCAADTFTFLTIF